ncbi:MULTISPECIES: hypothetical protein [unclassified Herbaspirillum]|uniref:hypothetical protein n=1 Tax=unclassified Herbaspirillum TaxID=2624150 RepID=UPI00114EE37E|nr:MULTISPECIES: hypothetical protein [unclassified Herbaspirillum]MBB5393043.1 hypothetical protein [Herbaspirillum sp. SJZ102]
MKFSPSTSRLVAAFLFFFVIGLQFVSAKSRSHELDAHTEHADGNHHADTSDAESDSVLVLLSDMGQEHSHKHDPSDYIHDIPLHIALERATSTFAAIWELRSPAQLHSIPQIPPSDRLSP